MQQAAIRTFFPPEDIMQIGVSLLSSGSSGNCTVIHSGEQALLIDCGISFKQVKEAMAQSGLDPAWIKAIMITHEHSDHIGGLSVTSRHLGVPIYATQRTAAAIHRARPKEEFAAMTVISPCSDFSVAGFNVRAFPVQHDADDPMGYVVTKESTKIGVATDFGAPSQMTNFQLKDCNTLVLESNYDLNMLAASTRTWELKQRILGPFGHLSNLDCAALLEKLLTEHTSNLLLAHISAECNKYELALQAARQKLAAMQRQDVFLGCGRHRQPIPTVWC